MPTTRAEGFDQRDVLHAMWASVAEAWEQNAAFIDARGANLTARMVELAEPRPGDRVLELACGAGGPGLASAPLVAPDGEVVVSDVAVEMTAIAARRAAERGLANVTPRVLDLEAVDEPDASFDVVHCREGLMLVPDPDRAAREIRRVLRPGGRAVVSVWGPRERNPWLAVVFDVVATRLGAPVPPPGRPHPFSLDDPRRLETILTHAGLARVAVEEIAVPYRASSIDEWWDRTAALAGPLARRLASLPAAASSALRDDAHRAIASFQTEDGLEIPGVALIATGYG